MGERSRAPETEEDVASLPALNGWISRAEFRASHLKLSASLKRSAMKRLVRLEAQRERLASTIVHETTHARLERYGIGYSEELRARVEAICSRRELAFAARLPASSELQQSIVRCLEWYQANSDQFSDAHFQERHTAGGIEALRYLGTPDCLIRAILMPVPIINRVRKLLRFRWRLNRPGRQTG